MAWQRYRYRKRSAEDEQAAENSMPTIEADPKAQPTLPTKELARTNMDATNSYTTNGHTHNGLADVRNEWSTRSNYANSVLILYGTVTGTAETLANKLAVELRSAGIAAAVRDMAHCQVNILTQTNCVLMVVSTYGDGQPPDDAAPFWQAVVHGNQLDLSGLRYSVLALGNTTFDQFCKCGRDFDTALERHGATRICPRVDCDMDYESPARHWLNGVLARLSQDTRILFA
jgi:sulfite reductase (NADPH) flavoprotein alpha-component